MAKYLVRFGSNSTWTECELDADGVRVAKEAGYDVVPFGQPVQIKNEGDMEVVMKSIVNAMSNSPVWWGCRNCDYEAQVDKIPKPDDGLCVECRDEVYNNTDIGVS